MDDYYTYIYLPFFSSFAVYWSLSAYFFLKDKYGDLTQRIDPNINWALYKKTVFHVLYLQFFYSFAYNVFINTSMEMEKHYDDI